MYDAIRGQVHTRRTPRPLQPWAWRSSTRVPLSERAIALHGSRLHALGWAGSNSCLIRDMSLPRRKWSLACGVVPANLGSECAV